ncbi:MAG: HipA domain-containing protein [Pirellulales bacterium]
MTACRICLELIEGQDAYHKKCLKTLFDTGRLPRLDIDTGKLHTAALAMVGHTSLSGIQKKISLGLDAKKTALTVVAEGGAYILKPQTGTYPAIPENEHVTTRLAELVGIETAPSGLVELSDGTLAFIVRRFDRLADGRKVHQEDFCQLAEEPPKHKYQGSAELCIKLVKRFASEPLIELLKLYRLLVFTWWSGNGDMHLKNFSLLIDEEGIVRLTPAYDLVSTHLVIENDPLALTVGGKDQKLARGDWLRLADYAGLPRKPAERVLAEQAVATDAAIDLLGRSYLSEEHRSAYVELIQERSDRLG